MDFVANTFRINFDTDSVRIYDSKGKEVQKSPIYYTEAESYHTLTSYIRDAMRYIVDIDFDEYHALHKWMHEEGCDSLEAIFINGKAIRNMDIKIV